MKYEMVVFYRRDLDQYSTPFAYPSLSYCVDELSTVLREKARKMRDGVIPSKPDPDLDLIPHLEFVGVAKFNSDTLKFEKEMQKRCRLEGVADMKEVYKDYVTMVQNAAKSKQTE